MRNSGQPWANPQNSLRAEVAAEHRLMDFDEYMQVVRETGATPYIVTAYDNLERTGISEDAFLEHAVEWLRYANVRRSYGIRYWEIGNENWHHDTGRSEDVARVVVRFAKAMRELDPTILIGASGCSLEWWEGFLPIAAPHIDFLTVSNYTTGGCHCYDDYRDTPHVKLDGVAAAAPEAIERFASPADRERLFVISVESNSMDFSPPEIKWPGDNNLGHALATADMLGQLMLVPKLRHALLWNTRWLRWRQPDSIWYALDPANRLLPSGHALASWGRCLRDRLVAIDSNNDQIVAYASASHDASELTVLLINKAAEAQTLSLGLAREHQPGPAELWQYTGSGPDDLAPTWSESAADLAALSLPPTSLSTLIIHPS